VIGMKRRLKAVLYTCLVATVFVVAPVIASGNLPPEVSQIVSMVGLDVQAILHTIVLVGVAMAALIFIKTDTDEGTVKHLIASAGLDVLDFYLTLYGFGLGDPWSFGLVERQLPFGNVRLTYDLRALIVAFALLTAFSVATAMLKYSYARETRRS